MRASILALLCLLLVPLAAAMAADWSQYAPASLADTVSRHRPAHDKTTFSPGVPIRATLQHAAAGREVGKAKRDFLAKWLRSVGLPSEHLSLFQYEVKFKERGREFWIPAQTLLVTSLRDDVQLHGVDVDAYVMLIGFLNGEPVLLLNRFDERERR